MLPDCTPVSTSCNPNDSVMTAAGPMPARYAALPPIPMGGYYESDALFEQYNREDFDRDIYQRAADAIESIPRVEDGFLDVCEPCQFGITFTPEGTIEKWIRPRTDDEVYSMDISVNFEWFEIDGRGDIHRQLIEHIRGFVERLEHGILQIEAAKVSFDWMQAHPEEYEYEDEEEADDEADVA